MRQWGAVGIIGLCLTALACSGTAITPPPPVIVLPTVTLAPPGPTATAASPLGGMAVGTQVAAPTAGGTPLVLPTAAATALPSARVVASHQAGGTYAVALLTAVRLTPGHSYRLLVSSPAGRVAFHGEWSSSAVGADGMPGVKVGLLDDTTPVTYDIVPPVRAVARDWLYSVSVQNKGEGGIALTLLDVTE